MTDLIQELENTIISINGIKRECYCCIMNEYETHLWFYPVQQDMCKRVLFILNTYNIKSIYDRILHGKDIGDYGNILKH